MADTKQETKPDVGVNYLRDLFTAGFLTIADIFILLFLGVTPITVDITMFLTARNSGITYPIFTYLGIDACIIAILFLAWITILSFRVLHTVLVIKRQMYITGRLLV